MDGCGRLSGTDPAGVASEPDPALGAGHPPDPGGSLPCRPWPAPVPGWHPRVRPGPNLHSI